MQQAIQNVTGTQCSTRKCTATEATPLSSSLDVLPETKPWVIHKPTAPQVFPGATAMDKELKITITSSDVKKYKTKVARRAVPFLDPNRQTNKQTDRKTLAEMKKIRSYADWLLKQGIPTNEKGEVILEPDETDPNTVCKIEQKPEIYEATIKADKVEPSNINPNIKAEVKEEKIKVKKTEMEHIN